jgi:hypothetical protein
MDESTKIANCQICTISEALKACNACAFSIGLAFKAAKAQELTISEIVRLEAIRLKVITRNSDLMQD